MAARGVAVTGSDDNDTPFLGPLRELGVTCHLGYDAAHLGAADTVVVTTAAREDNPEVVEARRRGLRLYPRSAGLAAVMAGQRVLAVAGTHGKTTTTSLLTVALQQAGAEPTYAVGGVLSATGRNSDVGDSDLFVAEADESDGAFLVYDAHAAIVLNVEADHLDIWGTEEAYASAFEEFVDGVDPDGFVVYGVDDPGAARLAERQRSVGRRVVTVGLTDGAELRAVRLSTVDGGTTFEVERAGVLLGGVSLRIPGRHYVIDALAALAMGLELGLDFEALADGLGTFGGTRRRMELIGQARGVRVFDSYAHHPSEIRGDIEAGRALADGGRVVVCFQPHLVSRTKRFGARMAEALGAADEVVVMDVYLAREDADPEVTGALVADAVRLPADRVIHCAERSAVVPELARRARSGDVVLMLGAGDITDLAPRLAEALGAESA
jgi:UDP-N-acetylmuramate--alanine ligase